jgi:hypothetical protein
VEGHNWTQGASPHVAVLLCTGNVETVPPDALQQAGVRSSTPKPARIKTGGGLQNGS